MLSPLWLITGGVELLRPALPAAPAQQRQRVHPQGGVLDHLQHHSREQSTDTGDDAHQGPNVVNFQFNFSCFLLLFFLEKYPVYMW